MATKHPHADAAYSIVEQEDRSYGVQITIPDTYPTMVTGFASRKAAEEWVAGHKRSVADHSLSRRPFVRRNPQQSRAGNQAPRRGSD